MKNKKKKKKEKKNQPGTQSQHTVGSSAPQTLRTGHRQQVGATRWSIKGRDRARNSSKTATKLQPFE
jgi:hypothetical protein